MLLDSGAERQHVRNELPLSPHFLFVHRRPTVQTPALQASIACIQRNLIFVRSVRPAHSRPGDPAYVEDDALEENTVAVQRDGFSSALADCPPTEIRRHSPSHTSSIGFRRRVQAPGQDDFVAEPGALHPFDPEHSWIDSCHTAGMNQPPAPIDLTRLSRVYAVSVAVLDDLYARRRAGAHDAELIDLLTQRDRGGLDRERARALVAELPAR